MIRLTKTVLSTALETKTDTPDQIVTVVRQLKVEQARRDLHVAQLLATRRSGARGAKARQALNEKEQALEEAEELSVDRILVNILY